MPDEYAPWTDVVGASFHLHFKDCWKSEKKLAAQQSSPKSLTLATMRHIACRRGRIHNAILELHQIIAQNKINLVVSVRASGRSGAQCGEQQVREHRWIG